LSRKEKPKIDSSALSRILLIRLRRIGDVVMTTPAVAALKEALPQAYLSYVIEEPYRRLVEGHPLLDKVIVIPLGQSRADFFRSVRQIRREKYDLVIDFHGGPRAFLLALFSGAKLKVGYNLKYKGFIYDIRVPRTRRDGRFHSVEGHAELIKAMGLTLREPLPPLLLPRPRKEEKERIDNFWAESGLEPTRVITLHIGAGNEFRDWGAENLIELTSKLARLPEIRIILVGSAEDRERENGILAKVQAPVLSLVGKANLSELQEVIRRSALFVGTDSGPMHIAAAASTPIVALFGPTLPANFAPWRAKAILIEKELECRPCKQRRCLTEDFRCLRTIRPAEVFEACQKLLQTAGPKS
jgi:lipopolysaccharide heptosyltransferase II